jgi:uncharacterized protein
MIVEGVVTNVAAFGAFVDVGVHQDGLVHVSAMARTFVKDPRDIVKPGDIVRVKVLAVDIARKRIGLTLRLDDPAGGTGTGVDTAGAAGAAGGAGARGAGAADRRQRGESRRGGDRDAGPAQSRERDRPTGALADALRRAGFDTDS